MTSIVIPAHNEERVLGRLLTGLLAQAEPNEFEVLVVSNGSTDRTVEIASAVAGVQVIDIAEASKHLALQAGNAATSRFPRLYIDADIELDTASARALVTALNEPGVLAAAPTRTMLLEGSSALVRAYYRVWEHLPAVHEGLYGRGVLAVSEAGFAQIAHRPQVMGDDLYLHSQFSHTQRSIVASAHSVVRGPKTMGDLVRRRTRAAQGNTELATLTGGATMTTASTSVELIRLARRQPRLWPSLMVYLAVTIVARLRARRQAGKGQFVWHRDESSRT